MLIHAWHYNLQRAQSLFTFLSSSLLLIRYRQYSNVDNVDRIKIFLESWSFSFILYRHRRHCIHCNVDGVDTVLSLHQHLRYHSSCWHGVDINIKLINIYLHRQHCKLCKVVLNIDKYQKCLNLINLVWNYTNVLWVLIIK